MISRCRQSSRCMTDRQAARITIVLRTRTHHQAALGTSRPPARTRNSINIWRIRCSRRLQCRMRSPRRTRMATACSTSPSFRISSNPWDQGREPLRTRSAVNASSRCRAFKAALTACVLKTRNTRATTRAQRERLRSVRRRAMRASSPRQATSSSFHRRAAPSSCWSRLVR